MNQTTQLRAVADLAGKMAAGSDPDRPDDPRLERLLAEMRALAEILPCAKSPAADWEAAEEASFDNLPV
ncbi:hypothetical protein GALL_504810 [mine drainage metagenome]|uniref:Uncharacterized protein n=1 Tax=mine drainage metagenome TaxID=410659 RepID=A0A1J5P9Q8_9ZZZZ